MGSRGAVHEAAHNAKEFLIAKIVLEAELEGAPLSEIERKMLYFSEVEHEPPDLIEVNEQFEKEFDSQEYEAKIAGLIKRAYARDRAASGDESRRWFDEIATLSKEDHYILVMVQQAHLRKPGDTIRLLGAGIAVAAGVAAFSLLAAKENLPESAAKFAALVFLFIITSVWILVSERRRAVAGMSLRMLLPTSVRRGQKKERGGSPTSKVE